MSKLTTGLKPRASYEELMNMITNDKDIVKIKKPFNFFDANNFLDSFEMSEIRKMTFPDLERMDENIRKQQLLEEEAKKVARESGTSTKIARETMREPNVKTLYYDMSEGDKYEQGRDDAIDEANEVQQQEEEKKKSKVKKTIKDVKTNLIKTIPNTLAHKIARGKYKPLPADLPADIAEPEPVNPEEIRETYFKKPTRTIKEKIIKDVGTYRENKIVDKVEDKILKKSGKQTKKAARQEAKQMKEEQKILNKGDKDDPKMQPKVIGKIIERKSDKLDTKRRKIEKEKEKQEMKDIIEKADERISMRKAQASMAKTGREIKALEDKKAKRDEYTKVKKEVAKEKQIDKFLKQLEKESQSASSSSGAVMVGNVKADNNTDKEHWEDMSIEKLREQAMIRGIKFKTSTRRTTLVKRFHELIDNNKLMI